MPFFWIERVCRHLPLGLDATVLWIHIWGSLEWLIGMQPVAISVLTSTARAWARAPDCCHSYSCGPDTLLALLNFPDTSQAQFGS